MLKKNTALQLIGLLSCILLFGHSLPSIIPSIFYSVSITLRDFLLFILPGIIFSYLFSSLLSLRGLKGLRFTIILFIVVFLSNYFSTLIAYIIASFEIVHLSISAENFDHANELIPLWNIKFPNLITNNHAVCFAFLLGTIFSFFSNKLAENFSARIKSFSNSFLDKCFIPLIPLFALGFILKMQYDGMLIKIINGCLPLILLITVSCILYLTLLFALVSKFNFYRWLKYIKNALPAALTGFATMSSLAAMPLTLKAAEKNTKNNDIAHMVIPSTVNIHMIGLGINIPLMALTFSLGSHHELPSFLAYNEFALYFTLMQFAVAATPGCGILLMLPLLETYFNFTGETSALITALYILFDSIETSINILGNSVLVIIISKIYQKQKLPTYAVRHGSEAKMDNRR